jgi:hypothetical protein
VQRLQKLRDVDGRIVAGKRAATTNTGGRKRIRCWTEAQFASAVIENRWSREEETELHLSNCIAGAVREAAGEVGNGLLRDLLTEALSAVAWHEVAAHFLAEIEEFGRSENVE